MTEPHDTADPTLPPGHVPTVRIRMREPDTAKHHIQVSSGWQHSHMAACMIELPKNICETGTAPVDKIKCPHCRKTPEFARATAESENARTKPETKPQHHAPRPDPKTATSGSPGTEKKKPTRTPAPEPQGSLF